MSTVGKRVALALGVVAGAALTAFAVSKSGQKEIKKLSERTLSMKDDILDTISKDVTKLKKLSKDYI